jgi:hypothetical protein
MAAYAYCEVFAARRPGVGFSLAGPSYRALELGVVPN